MSASTGPTMELPLSPREVDILSRILADTFEASGHDRTLTVYRILCALVERSPQHVPDYVKAML